jgi:hypothetical protein
MGNPLDILGDIIDGIIGFSDDAYNKGYLVYLLIALIVIFIIVMIQK